MKGDSHFDELEKRKFDYEFSDYAVKHMRRNKAEKILDKFIDRTYSITVKIGDFHNKYAFDELYYILLNLFYINILLITHLRCVVIFQQSNQGQYKLFDRYKNKHLKL